MGIYCEALAQMDLWTVCCLLLTDGICAGGGVGWGGEASAGRRGNVVSILCIPVLIPGETCERATVLPIAKGPPHRHLPAGDLERWTPW